MDYYYSGEEMPNRKYYIYYGTGAGDEEVEGTLAEAMRRADEDAAYTQHDIKIYLAEAFDSMGTDALPVAERRWQNSQFDADDEANRYITAKDVSRLATDTTTHGECARTTTTRKM